MSLYIRYPAAVGGGGGSGSAGGNGDIATAALYDPVDTSVTTGPAIVSPFVVDGVTVTDGMLVLFSNLGSGNNEIYKASISGSTITWTNQAVFSGPASVPPAGSLIVITQGNSFANQVGEFNGTTWLFNYLVRYFNGTDYYEQSSINTSTLADNTSNGTVFSVGYSGSQNILVNYSIIRSGDKKIGTLSLTTDGTNVAIASSGAELDPTGVTFSAVISGSDLVLQYTTTSTGSAATMKYFIFRWSDAAGGPGGPPSYSGGSAIIPAAGVDGQIQLNTGGVLGTSPVSTTFLDNQASPVAIVTMPAVYNAVYFNYTVIRGTNVKVGQILISTDGSVNINGAEDFSEAGSTGVLLSVSLSGGNIEVNYTSTSTGSGGTFKYAFMRW